MKVFLILLFISPKLMASYAALTLAEQVQSADQVILVKIVGGETHHYSLEMTVNGNPNKAVTVHKICGFTYRALVIEGFKTSSLPGEYITFSAIESFAMGADKLVFLQDQKSVLATDVITRSSSKHHNQKQQSCRRKLSAPFSDHLSTAHFAELRSWVSVNSYLTDLPESLDRSEFMSIQPENSEAPWSKVPSFKQGYGYYVRWHLFRDHLIETIGSQ